MAAQGPGPSTRSVASRLMIGHSRPDVPPRRLPTPADVLRVLSHAREQPGSKYKGPLSFCCPLNKEFAARCLLAGGCGERDQPCLQLRITLPFRKAGIITISDRSIQQRIVSLNQEYQNICQNKKKETPGWVTKREKYLDGIQKTWNIADPNARTAILNDVNRSEQAKTEDLAFFDDNFGSNAARKWELSGRDEDYDTELLNSLLSEEAKQNRKQEREQKKAAQIAKEKEQSDFRMKTVPVEGTREDDDEDCDNDDDMRDQDQDDGQSDWAETGRKEIRKRSSKKRKSASKDDPGSSDGDDDDDEDGVWVKVPRDILKLTAPTAVRMNVSPGGHVALLASVLRASDADLDKFTLSYSSSYRKRKEAIEEVYTDSREEFREKAINENWPLTLHFDEVDVEDTIGQGCLFFILG